MVIFAKVGKDVGSMKSEAQSPLRNDINDN